MRLLDNFLLAVKNIRLAKWRTFLCILAISIGICAVCIIRGFGSCATHLISRELGTIGVRGTTFYIDGPGCFLDSAETKLADNAAVLAESPFVLRTGYLTVRERRFMGGICGVNSNIAEIFSLKILYGRSLSLTDITEKQRSIVLDADTAQRAYGRENIVGKTLEISIGSVSDTFTVVGIIEAQQGGLEVLLGQTMPSICYIPHTTLNEMKQNTSTMFVVSLDKTAEEETRDQIAKLLCENTNEEAAVRYQNLDQYEETFLMVSDIVVWFATGVAAISALVAGIGVMNTMLSAVDARTHEIGVYMALGAKKKDLIISFFLETCITCLIGGLLGAGIYITIFLLLQQLLGQIILIETTQIVFGIGIAVCCGVVFGITPAIKVSSKDPIEILKAD